MLVLLSFFRDIKSDSSSKSFPDLEKGSYPPFSCIFAKSKRLEQIIPLLGITTPSLIGHSPEMAQLGPIIFLRKPCAVDGDFGGRLQGFIRWWLLAKKGRWMKMGCVYSKCWVWLLFVSDETTVADQLV